MVVSTLDPQLFRRGPACLRSVGYGRKCQTRYPFPVGPSQGPFLIFKLLLTLFHASVISDANINSPPNRKSASPFLVCTLLSFCWAYSSTLFACHSSSSTIGHRRIISMRYWVS